MVCCRASEAIFTGLGMERYGTTLAQFTIAVLDMILYTSRSKNFGVSGFRCQGKNKNAETSI